jgi:uncharacterized repeat protein (TIGR01451 family)
VARALRHVAVIPLSFLLSIRDRRTVLSFHLKPRRLHVTIEGYRGHLVQVLGLLTIATILAGCGGSTQKEGSAANAANQGAVNAPPSGSGGTSGGSSSSGAAPISPVGTITSLFSAPANESPVRADPDDLLLLPGNGLAANDTVVYRAVAHTTQPLVAPNAIPTANSATSGIADIVSVADAPYSLAVHLPAAMQIDQSYALWMVDAKGRWSNGVLINDARPLWITPDFAYQTASVANLPRVLKVVGRNLQPASASVSTQVRLSGSATYTLPAVADSQATTSATDPVTTPRIARYVAKVQVPTSMPTGSYTVQISRDGGNSWVPLLGENGNQPQTFTISANPATPRAFDVSAYGCSVGANNNALVCVVKAIQAAQAAGGGTVMFGPGVWFLELPNSNPLINCLYTPTGTMAPAVTCDGIIVPSNVNLQGAVSASSSTPATIKRGPMWSESGVPTFNLQGNNTVSNLYFADQMNYTPWDTPGYNSGSAGNHNNGLPGSDLQLGVEFWHAPGGDGPGSGGYYNAFTPTTNISHVVITENIFNKPYLAIGNGGLPIDHLMITYNTFGGAFSNAIYVSQNKNNAWLPYHFNDSIVAFNNFYPSSFYRYTNGTYQGHTVPVNTSGPIATQIGTGMRDDFSNNIADGRSTIYFYDQTITPANPKGWRAAFFWNTGNSQELTLVSENQALCSGDKAGDGEAIAYDGSSVLGGLLDINGNSAAALPVVASAAWTDQNTGNLGSTITVQGALVDPIINVQTQSLPASQFYPGQWLQIVQGLGVGQWRKIVSLTTGSNTSGATVAFNVVPAFDVAPRTSQPNNSVATISPAYWQNVTTDNYVDQSLAIGCTLLNQNYKQEANGTVIPSPGGGVITWFAPTADSAMEGNQQNSSSGIALYHYYSPAGNGETTSYAIVKSSSEVRNNVINGNHEWTSEYSSGGIQTGSGATATPAYSSSWNPTNPPITAFGITIAGNSISQTGATNFNTNSGVPTPMGAIAVTPGINSNGPTDPSGQTAWKMSDSTLIFHNMLTNITGGGLNRTGIGIANLSAGVPEAWRSVLYANSCNGVQGPMTDYGIGTVRYCPTQPSGSCECAGVQAIDVGVSASSSVSQVSIGSSVTYTATVTNNSSSASATGVTLSLEPSAGIRINSMTVTSGTGVCDLSVKICQLGTTAFNTPGTLAPSKSMQVTVTGTAVTPGTWSNTFSVTHHDADPVVANNGVALSTVAQ